MTKVLFLCTASCFFITRIAEAQLAITEAMSSETDTFTQDGVTNSISPNSDFWELSNFGTNAIELSGYKMADEGAGLGGAYSGPFDGLIIQPGEVIVFVQDSVNTTEQSFRDWWGLTNSTRIISYHNYGLSSSGDGMSLWDASDNLIDHAHVDAATKGVSFTYDSLTGNFGILSTNGVGGAFQAATADDVGSPGVNTGPVSLAFTVQPTNTNSTAGSTVTFTSAARGFPHPHFTWQRNGVDVPGATDATLTLVNLTTNNAGTYTVVITNGIQSLTSSNAVLVVNPAPSAPVFVSTPSSLVAYIGQNATFTGVAQGSPSPAYFWKKDGALLPGETTNTLARFGVSASDSGTYTLVASNSVGIASAAVALLVTRKSFLAITEVQSSESPGPAASADWFELSNLDTFPVDLFGYRWDDNSANLGVAYTITNHFVVQPGESVILVEASAPGAMTPELFKAWWGETNLPPNLQILVYAGNGLGLSSSSDQVNLWNQATTVETDPIGKVAAIQLSTAVAGRTFVRNPDTGLFTGNSTTGLSTNGLNGAFKAAQNGDVGSPGWYVAPLKVTITPTPFGSDLTWNSTAGRNYTVFYKNSVSDAIWSSLTNIVASAAITTVSTASPASTRIYRVAVTVH
jgi:hypothetical protein